MDKIHNSWLYSQILYIHVYYATLYIKIAAMGHNILNALFAFHKNDTSFHGHNYEGIPMRQKWGKHNRGKWV